MFASRQIGGASALPAGIGNSTIQTGGAGHDQGYLAMANLASNIMAK